MNSRAPVARILIVIAALAFCMSTVPAQTVSSSGPNTGSPAALAAGASAKRLPPADDFALGLQRLHWGMSSDMVYAALSGLKFRTGGFQPIKGYEYGGCLFDLDLSFSNGVLDTVRLSAAAPSAACRQQIVDELRTTFPAPVFTATNGTLSEQRWTNQNTSVFFYDDRMSLDVEFSARCQSIQVAVEPIEAVAATGPNIIPDANLGCDEYPPVSVALQEGGSVALSVHVLKDGSVSDAIITAASRSMRLNQAALRIALRRLRFMPAAVNGEAVDSDVSVKIDFAVTHPIHGRP